MNMIMDLLRDKSFWTIIASILSILFAWLLNERSKRMEERRKKLMEMYELMIKSLQGFYESQEDKEKKQAFLVNLNLCWMYSSDDVITKAYNFMDCINEKSQRKYKDGEREAILGELMLQIRYDMTYYTFLTARDYKHLKST